jgi:hypothetical protein
MVKQIYIATFFSLLSFSMLAQNLLSYVTVNNTTPYVGQPVQVKVSVYTTTWFTSGIDVGNIQVDKALTVYFRSVSSVKTIKGKKYAGVEFYYNVFPTQEGSVVIPSLEIHVETPKEGDYKGVKRVLRTKSKSITVKPVPLGYDPQKWLVSRSLSVNQKWSIPLTDIKVGDVVRRSIYRSARGTLSEFIPATKWDSIAGVSLYPTRSIVNTNKSRTGVSSNRSETVSYLFEKEGEIIMPVMTYMYWNPTNKKFYQKQLDSIRVLVKPNKDLVMLTRIKKSLQQEHLEEAKTEAPFLIFGVTLKTFIKYALFGLIVLILSFKTLIIIFSVLKKTFYSYLTSEKYAFNQVLKAINNSDYASYSKTVHVWLEKMGNPYPSVRQLIEAYGDEELRNTFSIVNEALFKHKKKNDNLNRAAMKKGLKQVRKIYIESHKSKNEMTKTNTNWLNPTRR